MMRRLWPALAAVAAMAFTGSASAAACMEQVGQQEAAALVEQCVKVNAIGWPACKGANSCEKIEADIKRGCSLEPDPAPAFCNAYLLPPAALTSNALVTGHVLAGGGTQHRFLTIRLDRRHQFNAYCGTHCGNWFIPAGAGAAVKLNPKLAGKPIVATIATERNAGRIAGAREQERLHFILRASIAMGD
ncbi:hypothetical protein ABT364_24025 [Massilia sp. SR12]